MSIDMNSRIEICHTDRTFHHTPDSEPGRIEWLTYSFRLCCVDRNLSDSETGEENADDTRCKETQY